MTSYEEPCGQILCKERLKLASLQYQDQGKTTQMPARPAVEAKALASV